MQGTEPLNTNVRLFIFVGPVHTLQSNVKLCSNTEQQCVMVAVAPLRTRAHGRNLHLTTNCELDLKKCRWLSNFEHLQVIKGDTYGDGVLQNTHCQTKMHHSGHLLNQHHPLTHRGSLQLAFVTGCHDILASCHAV